MNDTGVMYDQSRVVVVNGRIPRRGGERANCFDPPCLGARNTNWFYRRAYGRDWGCRDTP